ncbi:predicted protein [Naegleria gruberi]|uniref:Predicted protein n=1 Tax=Naegleria gruberi TaxID=5762 RepID=D2W1D2_NAEGR|nr:uncharacterized protein NAEGRDRAFT_75175 [Naegleria gruberi]EFC37165.1 predicted protein [Naegleria gruberi]|eukprot:XP_002669909.1 predicted protein [Naegleria gruberi strain NEG-M]
MSTTFDQVFHAVSEGNIEFLRHIDLRPFINHEQDDPDDEGIVTLLCTACGRGHLKIVELLLNVDGVDVNKCGPLFFACQNGYVEIVKLLLSVDGIDVNQIRVLREACEKGYFEIVKLLLDFDGINVDAYKALHGACYGGNFNIVKLLLAKNARIGKEERKEYDKKIKPKKDLFKSLAEIKDKIEDIEYAKDTLIFEIKTQKRNKIGKVEEIERLEKKLSDMIQELSNMHERKSEIQNDLMELIPKFPEIIIEMEQPLAIDGVVISSSMTPKEKFRVFALQNSILLLNTQFSNYTNIQTLHTGLSVVYKASKSNSQVVILKEISLSENNCETVMNEIMNLVILKGHPRIIKLNGVFIESQFNKVYIETPYYSNGNLLEYINKIRNHHDLPTLKNMLRSLFRKMTETLQFIHSKDILHRDLKPQNILVNENGEPIIADFGSSKKLIAQLTNNTMGVGTLKYMAPEVKRQEESPSEKSDIWSLGVSLYECWQLIQQISMMNNATVEILNFDSKGKVVLPTSTLNDEIDITLMKMLSHMFNSNPEDRPSSLTLLTDSDYFTNENPTTDILSKSNQKELEGSEKISLWQARLKKMKQFLPESTEGEIKVDIYRHRLLEDIASIYKDLIPIGYSVIFYKTFVKYKGETGIDAGGLSNEMYSKYIEAILESKHFQNSESSPNENFILTDEPLTDESKNQLRTLGLLLKKLLIDCDDKTVYLPLNSFIFYYLLNGNALNKETLQFNAISLLLSKFLREYDFELDNQIFSVKKCKNDEELQSITMEETFIDVLSKSEKPLIMENVQLFIISQLYSYFYSDLKIEKLKLIKQGFDWFNLTKFKQSSKLPPKLKEFLDLQGSNFDEKCLSVNELKILLSGQSYIDADLLLNEIDMTRISPIMQDHFTKCIRKLTKSQLRQLLVWMTSLSSIPIRGFSRKISIREYNRFESHTCSFVFDIPSQITNYEQFETQFMNCLRLSSVATMEDQ